MRHFGVPGTVVVVVVVPAAVISIPRLTLWVSAPFVPVTARVNEPVDDDDDALNVSVELAGVAGVGVTGPGRLTETPDGADPTHE